MNNPPRNSVRRLTFGYRYMLKTSVDRNWAYPNRFKFVEPRMNTHKREEGECDLCDENGVRAKRPKTITVKASEVESPKPIEFM